MDKLGRQAELLESKKKKNKIKVKSQQNIPTSTLSPVSEPVGKEIEYEKPGLRKQINGIQKSLLTQTRGSNIIACIFSNL